MMKLIMRCLLILQSFCLINIAIAAPVQIDGIAAVVNNTVITISQLQTRVAMVTQQLAQQKIQVPPEDVLSNQVLQMMINQELEQQVATRMDIAVTTEDVTKMIQMIAQQQNMTPTQLREAVKQQGIPEEQFISQLKQQIINDKLLKATVAPQITVTPQEVQTGMQLAMSQDGGNNQYHLQHIVVAVPDTPTPAQVNAARDRADEIIKELNQGTDFRTLAAAQSGDQQAFNGGDMGWKTANELPSIFADQVIKMKPGEVVGPIQTANGFHILKLIAVRDQAASENSEELKQKVTQMIFERKLMDKQQEWLEELRAGAYIDVLYTATPLPAPLN
jgi:peptidyl-prolyl cis-trans isomerase SurA